MKVYIAVANDLLKDTLTQLVREKGYDFELSALDNLRYAEDYLYLIQTTDVAHLTHTVYRLNQDVTGSIPPYLIVFLSEEIAKQHPQLGFWLIEDHAALDMLLTIPNDFQLNNQDLRSVEIMMERLLASMNFIAKLEADTSTIIQE